MGAHLCGHLTHLFAPLADASLWCQPACQGCQDSHQEEVGVKVLQAVLREETFQKGQAPGAGVVFCRAAEAGGQGCMEEAAHPRCWALPGKGLQLALHAGAGELLGWSSPPEFPVNVSLPLESITDRQSDLPKCPQQPGLTS